MTTRHPVAARSTKDPPSMRSPRIDSITRAAGLLVLVLAWQATCSSRLVSNLLVASPMAIAAWFANAVLHGTIWRDAGVTLERVLIAFVISAAIGVPTGLVMGSSKRVRLFFEFPIDFGRSIPATVLFPLFLIFFGAGEGSRIACAVYGATLIILVSSMKGVQQANPTRLRSAQLCGARRLTLFLHVLLPEALPSILTGFRLAVSLAFVIVVLVEMVVGTSSGLGHRMIEAQILYEIPEVYGLLVLSGTLGYLLNQVFVLVEARTCHYVGR